LSDFIVILHIQKLSGVMAIIGYMYRRQLSASCCTSLQSL